MLKRNYNIIHTHFAVPSGPVGNRISKKFKIPNVLSIQGGDIYDPSKPLSPHKTPILKNVVRRMLINADEVIAASSDTKRNASRFYGVNREINIIPLGIKPTQYPIKSRKELGLAEDKFIFSTIGRLIRRKNLEDLFEIIKIVNSSSPIQLLILGDGPERENLENKIRELDIEQSVKFLGRVSEEEKFQYLGVSDVYLSTAMHEGFGIVFLEAMKCGLPIICYDKGGQVDFLKDGLTGFLIQLDNKDLFIEKLKHLFMNKQKVSEIGNYNRKYVEKFFIRNIAQQYLDVFENLIRKIINNNFS